MVMANQICQFTQVEKTENHANSLAPSALDSGSIAMIVHTERFDQRRWDKAFLVRHGWGAEELLMPRCEPRDAPMGFNKLSLGPAVEP